MSNKKIVLYIVIIIIILVILIFSGIDSYNKEYEDENTKIHSRWSLYYAIAGIIIFFYMIYSDISEIINS